jgi:hypothetical protein
MMKKHHYTITSKAEDGDTPKLLRLEKTEDGEPLFVFHVPREIVCAAASDRGISCNIGVMVAAEMQRFDLSTARLQ